MTTRLLPRLSAVGLTLMLLGGCTGDPAVAAPASAALSVAAAHSAGVHSAGVADPEVAAAGTAGRLDRSALTADPSGAAQSVPALPRAKIDRILTRAEAAAVRARDAANLLAKTPIDEAKKTRKKTRAAAKGLNRAIAALARLAAEPGTAREEVDATLATVTGALATTKTAAKAARKWAKRIDRRLAQCPDEARACVDLTYSMTWLQRRGEVVFGPVKMASGRPGLRTRPGMWTVYAKYKDHVSGYYGLPMPYSIFFDHVGIAFHQGSMHELSHGCVHLTWKSSRAYWDFLHTGDRVFVFGYAPYAAGQTTV